MALSGLVSALYARSEKLMVEVIFILDNAVSVRYLTFPIIIL